MATALAVPLFDAAVLLTFCRVLTPAPQLLVQLTAFVPFALVGYLAAALVWLAGSMLSRGALRRIAAIAAAGALLGASFHAALLVPSYAGGHASGRPDLTVLTSNLHLGGGDPATITGIAERDRADVVVLEEVTPAVLAGLGELRTVLPHQGGLPSPGARGTVVLSRYPLTRITWLPVFQGAWAMRVAAPTPFWLIAVHTVEPGVIGLWRSDQSAVLRVARALVRTGPVVMAGDFNATLDHRPMRDLLGLGLSDAARQADSGWQPTWPGDPDVEHGLPFGIGLMALDHVLVSSRFSTISTTTYRVDGTDHRALLARIAVD